MAGRAKPGQPKSQAKQTIGKRVGRGAGKGDGWGGPANGEGGAKYRKGEVQPLQGKGHTPDVVASREAREAALTAHLEYLALNAEREETQVSATVHALNRLVGMPIQRQDVTSGGDKMPAIQIITGVPRGDDA